MLSHLITYINGIVYKLPRWQTASIFASIADDNNNNDSNDDGNTTRPVFRIIKSNIANIFYAQFLNLTLMYTFYCRRSFFFAHFHKLNWEKKARRKSWMLTKERRKIRTAWKQLRPMQNEGRKEPASERINGRKALRCQHDAVPWHAILKANEIDDRNLATWHEANFRGHIQ